jgi:hypothetical protein
MDHPIIDLMHACVVKLVAPAPGSIGSGFFVAPGLILTCAHVVGNRKTKKHCNGDIQVKWKEYGNFAIAEVKEWKPDLDLALLSYSTDQAETPPCVLFGRVCLNGDKLVTFGYPRDFSYGDPADFKCTGYTGDNPPFIRFKDDRVIGGMSGSPILNLETKRICGMVKFTVDPLGIAGGGGIWADTILKHFEDLEQLQEEHHQQDPRWYEAIGAKTPGALLDLVQNNIAEKLEDDRLQILKDCLGNVFKEKRGMIVRSAIEIASKLVEIEKEDTLLLLFLAQKNTVAELERKRAGGATRQYIRERVFDILGWLVLLAVNGPWLAENRNELYPEQFPGSIELPVKTDSGIEIIHAALNKRCARFDCAKGTTYGAFRIPTVDHNHFLESGISTADAVIEIKRAIYTYLNKFWGKEKIPDLFTKDEDVKLNTQLDLYKFGNEGRYLVVERSEKDCPLNDDVYKKLKFDLPALQVIFHNTGKEGTAFKVSEIMLDTQLMNFLLTK